MGNCLKGVCIRHKSSEYTKIPEQNGVGLGRVSTHDKTTIIAQNEGEYAKIPEQYTSGGNVTVVDGITKKKELVQLKWIAIEEMLGRIHTESFEDKTYNRIHALIKIREKLDHLSSCDQIISLDEQLTNLDKLLKIIKMRDDLYHIECQSDDDFYSKASLRENKKCKDARAEIMRLLGSA